MRANVLIAAGGTGGHVYPALAVAERLRERGVRVAWLGTRHGLEARTVPAHGFDLHVLRMRAVRGGGWRRWSTAPLLLAGALLEALVAVTRVRPRVVIGFGGYAAAPGGLAARLLGRKLVIHEQNAIPGLVNRRLAPLAHLVLEAFAGSFAARHRARHTGNPTREALAAVAAPGARLADRDGPLRLLVLGGSQGASALNRVVPGALDAARGSLAVDVLHQAGPAHLESTRARYRDTGLAVRVVGFIDDMAQAYGWADLVLCRAGAMTVAELTVAGVAAVLVPYPYAADDHQTYNARYLANAGAAVLVPETELSAARLSGVLSELAQSRARIVAMAEAARALAVTDATARVADACLELTHD